jgi:hypothetical protein
MNKISSHIFALPITLIILSTVFSCNNPNRHSDKLITDVPAQTIIPATFNADTAYLFVKHQVDFGPRVSNSEANKRCALWLENTLKRFTPDVKVQSFTAKAYNGAQLNLKNIIASFKPQAEKRVLLCSHWDSRPYADNDPEISNHRKPIDGANDGASGVGVLIEIARQLSMKSPAVGVDIILFDGEDYGSPEGEQSQVEDDWCLGSQYWSRNPHVPAYSARFGILLDMVGAAAATFSREGTSMYYAPDYVGNVWNIASKLGYSSFFVNDETGAIIDDHSYINELRQIPTLDIIHHDPSTQSGFCKYWHTIADNMQIIDKQTLLAVGQTVLTTVYQEE